VDIGWSAVAGTRDEVVDVLRGGFVAARFGEALANSKPPRSKAKPGKWITHTPQRRLS
jgi:hypothetical protein